MSSLEEESRNFFEAEQLQRCSGSEIDVEINGDFFFVSRIFLSLKFSNQTQHQREIITNLMANKCCGKQGSSMEKIPDQREPKQGRVSALEKAMRSYVDRKSGHVVAPEIGREFDSLAEAIEFYNLYSWEIGFGIRYGQCRRNAQKSRTVQDFVCGYAGKPRKENTSSVASNCQTLIRLFRTRDNGRYIHDFRPDHNHHLSSSCSEKVHWLSHRIIDTYTKDIVKHLTSKNIGITKVFSVIASFFGSIENVPFNKRLLNYLCKRMNQETAEDDIRKIVELLSELKKNDPMFADSVLVDSKSKIKELMWTNGRSRYQYKMFGDAITFDTTYRTNQYDMPFGLFVGVNHHFQSIILGGVLMRNEKEETFDWVFKEFVSLMGGKAPATILTDQCRAMEFAIANVLPGIIHHWCRWHFMRRAKETLGPAYTMNKELMDELHKILVYMPTIEEFEAAWQTGVLRKDDQHAKVRERQPYVEEFCTSWSSMHMFIKHYQKLQFDRDAEENFAEKKSHLGSLVLKSGLPLERHAGKLYTPALFKLFQEACFKSASYYVENTLAVNDTYCVTHLYADRRESWSKTSYNVKVQQPANFFQCECGMYEHMGLLCCLGII